ncbi:MAG: MarR family transcriptional regulator [Candidatus Dormibacteraceae bacterium]
MSDDAFEMSKLLVELLHVGGYGRAQGGRDAAALSPNAIRAAIEIYQHGEVTVSQLATALSISQGWASRLTDEMEQRGYLERERDPRDRRIVRLRLPEPAVEAVERSYRWRGEVVEAALNGLTARERELVRHFLEHVVEGLRG